MHFVNLTEFDTDQCVACIEKIQKAMKGVCIERFIWVSEPDSEEENCSATHHFTLIEEREGVKYLTVAWSVPTINTMRRSLSELEQLASLTERYLFQVNVSSSFTELCRSADRSIWPLSSFVNVELQERIDEKPRVQLFDAVQWLTEWTDLKTKQERTREKIESLKKKELSYEKKLQAKKKTYKNKKDEIDMLCALVRDNREFLHDK